MYFRQLELTVSLINYTNYKRFYKFIVKSFAIEKKIALVYVIEMSFEGIGKLHCF